MTGDEGHSFSETRRVRISSALWVAFAALACLSSSLILIRLWRIPNWHTFHRLMLGVAGLDFLQWSVITLGPLLLPKHEMAGVMPTFGNAATCRFQGFAFSFGFGGSYLYNALLMLYFLLVIRYGLTERFLAKRVEPWLHLLGIGVYLVLALLILVKDYIHAYALGAFCDVDMDRSISSVFWLLSFTSTIFAVVFLILTVQTVNKRYAQTRRYIFADSIFSSEQFRSSLDRNQMSSPFRDTSSRAQSNEFRMDSTTFQSGRPIVQRSPVSMSSNMNQRQALVISQALLYGFFFVSTGLILAFVFVTQVIMEDNKLFAGYSWIEMSVRNLYPLLSVFNLVVFIRPHYKKLRRPYQGHAMTRWQAFWYSIRHPVSRDNSPRQHGGQRPQLSLSQPPAQAAADASSLLSFGGQRYDGRENGPDQDSEEQPSIELMPRKDELDDPVEMYAWKGVFNNQDQEVIFDCDDEHPSELQEGQHLT